MPHPHPRLTSLLTMHALCAFTQFQFQFAVPPACMVHLCNLNLHHPDSPLSLSANSKSKILNWALPIAHFTRSHVRLGSSVQQCLIQCDSDNQPLSLVVLKLAQVQTRFFQLNQHLISEFYNLCASEIFGHGILLQDRWYNFLVGRVFGVVDNKPALWAI